MKFAPVFLSTFILVGCQQPLITMNPKFLNPFIFSSMRSFDSPFPAWYIPGNNRAYIFNPRTTYGLASDNLSEEQEESEGRYNLVRNQFNPAQEDVPMQRFLFNIINPGTTSYRPGSYLFKTVLSTSVITTTIPSVSLCIPANQFSAGAAATACARRRREIAQILDDFALSDDGDEQRSPKFVHPSPVEGSETTAVLLPDLQAISSSKDENVETETSEEDKKRAKRLFNIFAVTTTITSYSFVTTVVPKQVSIVRSDAAADCSGGAAQPSCLGCVPPGYGVC